jgi:hypothetical protein
MATAEALLTVIGLPVNSGAVLALVAADRLAASVEPECWSVPRREYLSGLASGYALTHAEGRVVNVAIYAEPAEGFTTFPGPLPGGLPRGATREEVRARFGTPERSGEAVTITGLGRQGAWDRFAVDGVRVHFQYTEPGKRVRLVSVMAADVAS